jgi:hypothetical protein
VSAPQWPALAVLAGCIGVGIGASLCACPSGGGGGPVPVSPESGYPYVYDTLTEAGCLVAAPGVMNALVAQEQTGHSPWIDCMREGGTILGCNAPCERAGWVRRPDGAQ